MRLVLTDGRCNAAAEDNHALKHCCIKGYTETVRLLLTIPVVDPTAENHSALKSAFKYARMETLRLLLSDPRVDVTTGGDFEIFTYAIIKNRPVDDLRLLINSSLSSSSSSLSSKPLPMDLLRRAFELGRDEKILELLMEHIDPSQKHNWLLKTACRLGCYPLTSVRFLIKDPRVDLSAGENFPLRSAAANGFLSLVALLLEQDKSRGVDAAALNGWAAKRARENGHDKIVDMLKKRGLRE